MRAGAQRTRTDVSAGESDDPIVTRTTPRFFHANALFRQTKLHIFRLYQIGRHMRCHLDGVRMQGASTARTTSCRHVTASLCR